jgi:hypothetical protein
MLDDDHTGLAVAGQPLQGGQHLLGADRVQVGERLVEHEHPGPHGQRGGDRGALLLPAGQRHQRRPAQAGHPGHVQAPVDPGGDLGLRQGQVLRPERHLRLHRLVDQLEVRVLEHQASELRRLVRLHAAQRAAAEGDPAAQLAGHPGRDQPAQG